MAEHRLEVCNILIAKWVPAASRRVTEQGMDKEFGTRHHVIKADVQVVRKDSRLCHPIDGNGRRGSVGRRPSPESLGQNKQASRRRCSLAASPRTLQTTLFIVIVFVSVTACRVWRMGCVVAYYAVLDEAIGGVA